MLTRSGRLIGTSAVVGFALLLFCGLAYAAFFSGTDGDDTLIIEQNSSTAYMRGGDDRFTGAKGSNGGSDHVHGGAGNDRLVSYTRIDELRGGRGNDHLDGGAHRDGLFGATGNDKLIGGPGMDQFQPGRGTDTCFGQFEDVNFPGECEVVRVVEP